MLQPRVESWAKSPLGIRKSRAKAGGSRHGVLGARWTSQPALLPVLYPVSLSLSLPQSHWSSGLYPVLVLDLLSLEPGPSLSPLSPAAGSVGFPPPPTLRHLPSALAVFLSPSCVSRALVSPSPPRSLPGCGSMLSPFRAPAPCLSCSCWEACLIDIATDSPSLHVIPTVPCWEVLSGRVLSVPQRDRGS